MRRADCTLTMSDGTNEPKMDQIRLPVVEILTTESVANNSQVVKYLLIDDARVSTCSHL